MPPRIASNTSPCTTVINARFTPSSAKPRTNRSQRPSASPTATVAKMISSAYALFGQPTEPLLSDYCDISPYIAGIHLGLGWLVMTAGFSHASVQEMLPDLVLGCSGRPLRFAWGAEWGE